MSQTALEKINLANLGIPQDTIKRIMNEAIWAWYEENQDDVIFEKKVFFFSIKLRVRDLRFLIERIAGLQRPTR